MLKSDDWMAYIETEIAAVCAQKGWGHQIRRKWPVRHKLVESSSIDDYEWKLLPAEKTEGREDPSDQGTYYVLSFNATGRKFILQHDTEHTGLMGDHWYTRTYTEFDDCYCWLGQKPENFQGKLPPAGWLQRRVFDLTTRFGPNRFSAT